MHHCTQVPRTAHKTETCSIREKTAWSTSSLYNSALCDEAAGGASTSDASALAFSSSPSSSSRSASHELLLVGAVRSSRGCGEVPAPEYVQPGNVNETLAALQLIAPVFGKITHHTRTHTFSKAAARPRGLLRIEAKKGDKGSEVGCRDGPLERVGVSRGLPSVPVGG